jgi:anti-anti-sigma factor
MPSRKLGASPLKEIQEPKKAFQLLAQREYSLQALMDLSQALTQPHDLYGTMDALLLNLVGQFRLSRACVWLLPEGGPGLPVFVRGRGVDGARARIIMDACAPRLMDALRERRGPLTVESLTDEGDAPIREFASRAGLLIFAPIPVRDDLLGIMGLGARLDGEPCTELDLQLLQASLAIASVALENGRFYGRLLENSRELRMTKERLEDLDRLKFEFLGNINHELRTPLSIIIASLDCLSRVEQDSSSQEFLRYASSQAQKLLELVENLLTLSAASRDSHRPVAAIGDLVAAVSAYYQERLPGVSSSLRELTFTLEARDLRACFDEQHLKTIMDALIENAVKFTPVGTRIRLRVREATEQGETWVRIDVEDNGPGIPSAELPTLFEPFRQLDGSLTRAVGGMGIGLALARQLAQGLGGRLTVTSQEGEGSTFSLFLPAAVQFASEPADDKERRGVMMAQDLEISEVEHRGRTAVLRLKGRLDVKTSPVLLQRVGEIQANGQNLVLNLAEVSFMGSSGIGALLVLVEQFQEQAGVVRLASPSPAVESVIKLLNLDRFLAIDPSEDKALAEIGS